jgi:hypothetical protein
LESRTRRRLQHCHNQEIKDGPSGASWTFRLIPFNIGATKSATTDFDQKTNEIGSEDETCVVELMTEPSFATKSVTKPKPRLTGLAGDLFKVIKRAIDDAGVTDHNSVTAPRGARAVSKDILKAYCVSMAWQDPEGNPHGFRTMLARHLSGLRAQELIGFDRDLLWLT